MTRLFLQNLQSITIAFWYGEAMDGGSQDPCSVACLDGTQHSNGRSLEVDVALLKGSKPKRLPGDRIGSEPRILDQPRRTRFLSKCWTEFWDTRIAVRGASK